MRKTHLFILALALVLAACTKPKGYGDLSINIDYSINGNPLITDTLCYTNEAGNEFMITEIQWFLSHIELQDERGDWFRLDHKEVEFLFSYPTDWVFYIDTNIPESQTLETAPLPVGKYNRMRFTFGLNEDDNQTGLFSDPPESNMFWPEPLGGGYHYIKLNGRFVNANGELVPLNTHLGIGQNADHTVFYQNHFTVELPIDFTIAENTENQLHLTMIVDNWFRSPNLYDFNEYGSAIMQNQAAQQALKENGNDVFCVAQDTGSQNLISMKKEEKTLWEKLDNTMQKAAPKPHFWTWEKVQDRVRSWELKVRS